MRPRRRTSECGARGLGACALHVPRMGARDPPRQSDRVDGLGERAVHSAAQLRPPRAVRDYRLRRDRERVPALGHVRGASLHSAAVVRGGHPRRGRNQPPRGDVAGRGAAVVRASALGNARVAVQVLDGRPRTIPAFCEPASARGGSPSVGAATTGVVWCARPGSLSGRDRPKRTRGSPKRRIRSRPYFELPGNLEVAGAREDHVSAHA